MKYHYLIIFFFILGCSFDNKTGIWKNETIINDKKDVFKEFKKISASKETFLKTIPFKNNYIFNIPNPTNNFIWNDFFYSPQNNFENFSFNNLNEIFSKSKKLTKNQVNLYKLYEDGNIIINDSKGNIIIYSIKEEIIISKFNFYKKKYKKFKKDLNLIIENNIIFAADNLGFIYAYDYKKNKVIWAKNYKIPFSSNFKISKNKLIISNKLNNLYILNKNNGDLIKLIPTENTQIKNEFKNNLSIKNDNLFFLNSFGSLYSVNLNTMRINWFNNFNQSIDLSPSNLFVGNIIVGDEDEIIISNNTDTYFIDLMKGSTNKKFNFTSSIRPLVINRTAFFLTDSNFLIAVNMNEKEIIYSYDISKIDEISDQIQKSNIYKDLMIINNKIYIFLKNSYVLNFSLDGQFLGFYKLPSKIKSSPIIIDRSIIYLNNKNKLIILD